MIEACIFDLDGVICDTAKYHFLAWQKTAQSFGIEFTHADNEHLKGVSRVDSLRLILEKGNVSISSAEFELALDKKNTHYLSLVEEMTPQEILPGVEDFLRELQANHIKIALGSASKNAPLILEKIGLTHYFDAIIDGNQVINGKPNPEVFLKGANAVGVHPAKAVVFEDAVAGVDAALAGKFMAVGIGEPTVLHKAHIVIDGFKNTNLALFQSHFDTLNA